MHSVTAFSGHRGRSLRAGTAALLSTALAGTTSVLGAGPASAWGDTDGAGAVVKLSSQTTDELTDGDNHIRALGAADKDTWGDTVVLSFPLRSFDRVAHDDAVVKLAGGVAYTGDGPDVTWTQLRVNFGTDRITAVVNGGDRMAVLRTDGHDLRSTWDDDDSLRLTGAGARSLNRAAAGTPFSAGDVFAADSVGCG